MSAALLHDVKLVGASLVFLVLFASVAFGLRGTRRAWLGPAALLSVVLALVTAFGWWIGCGGSFHALMAAAVFMTLGSRGRATLDETSRGDAAAATWIFRGDERATTPRQATWIFRGDERGDAAAATWIRGETSPR